MLMTILNLEKNQLAVYQTLDLERDKTTRQFHCVVTFLRMKILIDMKGDVRVFLFFFLWGCSVLGGQENII